jgi:ATP-dependent Clp protease adaptor protein ClpS
MSTQTIEQPVIDSKEEIKVPSKYMVIFFNDNVTSFEFVMFVLISVFNKAEAEAYKLTLNIHEEGEAVVGRNYSLEVAKNKVNKVKALAKQFNFPLKAEYREQK